MTTAFQLSGPVAILGLITGTTYGLLAVGLVLVHRSSRVVNFAHGDIGAFAAAAFGVFVVKSGAPYYAALPLVILLGGGLGIVTEMAVMRRLRSAPPIVKIVATIGFASFLQVFSLVVNSQARFNIRYPEPPWFPAFTLGPLHVTRAHTAMLVLTPLLVGGLAWFVQRSRYGIAIRGAAANRDAARLAGVSASRMSAISWGLAGALSGYTAVLVYPTLGFGASSSFGPGLLLRALAAAVIARMTNLPLAFLGGLGVGLVEQELRFNYSSSGPVDAVLLGVILVALLLRRKARSAREEDRGDWVVVEPWPKLPRELQRVPSIRALGWVVAGVAAVVAVGLGAVVTNSAAVILVAVMAFSIIGLGIGMISGLAGQLSLGQFALAGVGSSVSFVIVDHTANFAISFVCAGLAGAAVSVALGIPAVRIRGLMFAVATLAFAQAAPWVFQQTWLFGIGKDPGRPIIAGYALDTSRRYYYFSLLILAAALLVARNIWHGGLGRRYRAVRDNEDNARAFTISALRAKLEAFAVAGFVTGIGGAVYAHSLSSVSGTTFPVEVSLTSVAIVAVGGIGLMAGPILGALYLIALPRFLPLDNAGLAATQLAWLLLVLQFPGGVAQGWAPARAALIARLARRAGVDPTMSTTATSADTAAALPRSRLGAGADRASSVGAATGSGAPLLTATGLVKTYGGVHAVGGVDIEVFEHEVLGLIGPNGAGKTTLFELLGGFARADEGRITFAGDDISDATPERRGRLGLIRSFQDAALFPTLTVTETVALALERTMPTRLGIELAGLKVDERRKDARASELMSLMGLDAYRDKRIGELSTGTRRVTELACLLALEPKLLLLDEPTSGIAQRESEAMGELLARVKEHLGTTLVVIEHDIPLIMSISDRVVAMAAGQILTVGTPAAVRAHPDVVASYLGTSTAAIERSNLDTIDLTSSGRCRAHTRSGEQCSRVAGDDELCGQHRRLAGAAR